MVNLLDLPAEIFDHIIAAIFDAEHGYPVPHCHEEFEDIQEMSYKSKELGGLRLVHSRFRASLDPHIFRHFHIGCDADEDDQGPHVQLNELLAKSAIAKHLRRLRVESITILDYSESPAKASAKLVKLLELVSPHLEVLVLGEFQGCVRDWHTLDTVTVTFTALRSVRAENAEFAFCIPHLAYWAPLLECISLDGHGVQQSYEGMLSMEGRSKLEQYVLASPVRALKRLVLVSRTKHGYAISSR